ncbi:MAG TPA: D-alanyl-D-alanine carboxypeptidase/D-alanyl-D-alanine-endopeptidase [Pseudomonas sp.]|jgi:D-alanyl-D-alanine carboxypeptidase/D-alanyl-D-alanine-endopeptidase (penicillin-binding protein 4)|uniref:D-alanyl-D-alanine carboxypeptidase/D-alanyl-D-alanine-endopeptidase n=1 Tax=Pseudomonas helleri TaxID=1608996 RepID=A0A6A7ZD30_9PSED|nr:MULTISPECIES: D-alanyl-D-alanine carboxypeptidase/D-alanyl-D-alanine-endopeptidase [Pseudomonas]KMN23938.1 D-alanyl-D-alanine carboxypeptidase [Pseudomonas helleri]MQT75754.1 D-alanyl-D-alanine carboxypeptidase/D-alanyl-D-alanine-endopeptidase [Pseudomonas helleri]MQT96677.1 D-alanyl-D-alanine carboxypeptidase/D-alanyl-D-alanine-endopeptidase [Pseudomonas helleri]MQU06398.1 D-alanyl-D-alanine carboxypeptidase/D-alanyl-D-alanine-endopeptidase [Pseudomonas helleri]MQU31918.1 D-alanyl-D-alanin
MIKSLRPLFLASLFLPLAFGANAAPVNATLTPKVQQALKTNKLQDDALSLVLLPLTGPGVPTVFNADVSMNPASTMKLVTTYAALEMLGPTHQWKTEFYTDGTLNNGILQGNLYLKGGGDPKLNMEKLWLLMRDLRANGVQQITGDLVLDRNFFEQPQLPVFNDDGNDENKPFLVKPDALMVNLKALRFVARNDSGKVLVSVEPPIASIRIDNQVKAINAKQCTGDVRYNPVTQADGSVIVTVSGQLADGCNSQTYLSLLDHATYTAGAVRAIWKELGGSIQGQDRQASVPKGAKLLARAYSPDLAEIIRDINKYSNNTMAQQLFLSLGAQFRTDADGDDAKAAQRVIRQWLAKKGITAPHLVMENGSGLSRAERVSAREMAQMLQAAWKSPYAAEFISSLPIAGKDGTMRKRLKTTAMNGQAHIKTGTLNTVRAISGFSRDSNGDTWAVVAILNDPRPWGASSILDQVLLDLYRQPAVANRAVSIAP